MSVSAIALRCHIALPQEQNDPLPPPGKGIALFGFTGRAPADNFPQGFKSAIDQQKADLARLISQTSTPPTSIGLVERYEVRHPQTMDYLSMWRIAQVHSRGDISRMPPMHPSLMGYIPVDADLYPIVYASTVRGIDEREQGISAIYYGTIRRFLRNPLSDLDSFLTGSFHEMVAVMNARHERGETWRLGTTLEIIPAVDPDTGEYMVMIRVPYLSPTGKRTWSVPYWESSQLKGAKSQTRRSRTKRGRYKGR